MNALFENITHALGHRAFQESRAMKEVLIGAFALSLLLTSDWVSVPQRLVQLCPELAAMPTLQQMSLAVMLSVAYGSTNHVTLVGLPQMRYVTELIGDLPKQAWRLPPDSALNVLRTLRIDRDEATRAAQPQAVPPAARTPDVV
jgi:hypothetical protein